MYNNKRKNQPLAPDLTSFGKIQPQAREFEEAVLGAIMLEKEAFITVENILQPDDFYDSIHQLIYKAIVGLSHKRNPIDMLTVVEELRRNNELEEVGGPVYIAQLTEKVGSSAHIEYHARIIAQKSLARKLISVSSKITQMAFDDSQDVDEVFEEFEKSFTEINPKTTGFQAVDMRQALKIFVDHAAELQKARNEGKVIAIPAHLNGLTKALEGGWRPGEFIIIGGRPSMGKTQHALAIAMAAAAMGQDCLFVSIEMTLVQLITRLILEEDSISSFNLRTGQMSPQEWESLDGRIHELLNVTLHISDHHSIRNLNNIKTEARRLHRQGKLKIMIIDYLQLIKTNMKFERRQLEVAYITGELKNLAKELGIPIIALSQLSRPMKGAKVKEPDLEDLREAGDIEQDADFVGFIHLPAYYIDSLTEEEKAEWYNKGMFIIRKSREGARNDTILFQKDDRYKKITDYREEPKEAPAHYVDYSQPREKEEGYVPF